MKNETTESDSKATKPLDTLIITHYQTIRDEILARMEMRQTMLTVYLGFAGTIFGLAMRIRLTATSPSWFPS
jgi:cysteine synthase